MDVQLAAMLNQRERERRLRQAAQERLLTEIARSGRRPRAWQRRLGMILIALGSRLESAGAPATSGWAATPPLASEG